MSGDGPAAVFLDRDGTIVQDLAPGFLRDPAGVRLFPGAGAAIARLVRAALPVIVVTNQSGIARGFLTWEDYHAVARRIDQLLAAEGGRLAATYVCPHFPEVSGPCLCRKPGLAHFLAARDRFGLTLERSWWVGDRISDLEPARSFGGSGILVRTGNGTGAVEEATAMGFAVVEDLAAAVELALGREAAS